MGHPFSIDPRTALSRCWIGISETLSYELLIIIGTKRIDSRP